MCSGSLGHNSAYNGGDMLVSDLRWPPLFNIFIGGSIQAARQNCLVIRSECLRDF